MHPRWNNNRNKTVRGYIRLYRPEHRNADPQGWVYEHKIVYEEYYKCCILPWGIVHHKNHIKDDNRIENLEGMTTKRHKALHIELNDYYRKQHHRGKRKV